MASIQKGLFTLIIWTVALIVPDSGRTEMHIDQNGNSQSKISWSAPTENVDGTPINYELSYNLYINGINSLVLPGTLNQDGKFEAELGVIAALDAIGTYVLTLTAFNVDTPAIESAESNSVTVITVAVPLEPADLSLE